MAYGAIYRKTLNFNCRVKARLAVLLGVTLDTAACATGPLWSPPPEGAADPRATAPEFTFVSDTFAFANLIRARHRGEDDLYANYCFVLRSEEHTSELQSRLHLVCRLLLEKKKKRF